MSPVFLLIIINILCQKLGILIKNVMFYNQNGDEINVKRCPQKFTKN